jgi:hypothetical protein
MPDTPLLLTGMNATSAVTVATRNTGSHDMLRILMIAAVAAGLGSCAMPYAEESLMGGFSVKELRPDVYRVGFQGNGLNSQESVQTYWLYRCAGLALEKGFAGFEILSDMHFVMRRPSVNDVALPALESSTASLLTRIPVSPVEVANAAPWRSPGDLASRPAEPIRIASAVIFFYGGAPVHQAAIEGDVHFIAGPVESAPPRIFSAKALHAQLEPIIKGEKCSVGNVCPHVHEYLLPKGKLR